MKHFETISADPPTLNVTDVKMTLNGHSNKAFLAFLLIS